MCSRRRIECSVCVALILALLAGSTSLDGAQPSQADAVTPFGVRASGLTPFPATFAENRGQWQTRVRYALKGRGGTVLIEDEAIVYGLRGTDEATGGASTALVTVRLDGSEPVRPEGIERGAAVANYYRGPTPEAWTTGVPTFRRVMYRNVYKGIDLVCEGRRMGLKYEFHIAPGADPGLIAIRYEGVSELPIDGAGRLRGRTSLGEVVDEAPVAWQEGPEGRRPVDCAYRLIDDSAYVFDVSGRDPSLPLVIDPYLEWSTLIGGTAGDYARGVATDSDGNVYVGGYTDSPDFPTANAYDATHNGPNGSSDGFVSKFSPEGELLWSTFLGGSTSADSVEAVGVYGNSAVYVGGYTHSSDFPTLGDNVRARVGGVEAFVARFSPAGALVWSTYLGGSNTDECKGLAVDEAHNIYVGGYTGSANFPTLNAYNAAFQEMFLTCFNGDGAMAWSTFLGGNAGEQLLAVGAAAGSGVCAAGQTDSTNFPTVDAWQDTLRGSRDMFVVRFTAAGALAWSTYLGGAGDSDTARGVACDADGNVYVAGIVYEDTDFPAGGAFDSTPNGRWDTVVAKFNSGGDLEWATFLGGTGEEYTCGIAACADGSVCVVGVTESSDFPVFKAYDPTYNGSEGNNDAFVTKLNSVGGLVWSTYLGGGSTDYPSAVAAHGANTVHVVGGTYSGSTWPLAGPYAMEWEDGRDAYVSTFVDPPALAAVETPFVVRQLTIKRNTTMANADKYMLKATLNATGFAVDWAAAEATFAVGAVEHTLPAGSFVTRNGTTYAYTASRGTTSGILRAQVDTKKRTVLLSAAGLDMTGVGPDVTVRLAAGDIDATYTVEVDAAGTFNYGRLGAISEDTFSVDKAKFARNTRLPNKDAFSVSGVVYSVNPLNPAGEDFSLRVGGKTWIIPAGGFVKAPRGEIYSFKGARGAELAKVTVDLAKGTFKASRGNCDLSSLGSPLEVSLEMGAFAGTATISPTQVGNNLTY